MNANQRLKILIPLDGSPAGEAALLALFPLIRSHRTESVLFHVTETPEAGEKARAHLEKSRAALEGQGVPTQVRIVKGRPSEAIAREAANKFDLIAMATQGRTGLERVLLGSVAEEVVRTSTVPTLLCKSGVRIGDWDRIVVALDGTPGSEEILGDAAVLAKRLNATLHLTRVGLGLLMIDGYRGKGYEFKGQDPAPYLEEVAAQLAAQGVRVVTERRDGMPGVEIPQLARELDAGLVCMTTEGRSEKVPGLGRSVAAEVIRSAPCPVYVRRMTGAPGTKETRKKPAGAR